MLRNNQVKIGAILSYVLIIINTLYGLLLTPYILGKLGDAEYGVYKTITSLSSALMVLDLGIGGTVMRYVAAYRAKKEEEKIPNFLFMMLIQAVCLCLMIAIVGVVVGASIDSIYATSFSQEQLLKAKQLFIVLMINMCFHVVENVVNGVISGCNQFVFGNGLKIIRLILRIALIFFVLKIYSNSLMLVLIDVSITIVLLIVELMYIRIKLGLRIHFSKWDKSVFFESGKYTVLMFLTSIAAQVNNNLDNVMIGSLKGPDLVTIYSMGLLIFSMYEQLSTSISAVMLPTVSNILEENDANVKIVNLIVQTGRIQFALLGAAVVGFAVLGKQFINLWLGSGFDDVYAITLILMIPALFELCVNVCLSVLRAKNMLSFRTIILFASTAINAIVTVLLVKYWSYIGASFGTAASFIIGSLIIMNIYYYKKLNFPMLKIYKRIFHNTWVCIVISGVATYVSSRFIRGNWFAFVINVLIFIFVYCTTMVGFGLNKQELASLPGINKIIRRIRK